MNKCKLCEEENENLINVEGDLYCDDCLQKMIDNGEIDYCAICENYYYTESLNYVENDTICNDCLGEYYTECADCGEWHHNDNSHLVYRDGEERYVCDNCFDNNYYYCDNCTDYYHVDNIHEGDDGNYYCEECYSQCNSLYEYHEFRDWSAYELPNEEEPPYYIGYELEVDNGSDINSCINVVTNNLNAVCMHDGSLGYKGFEIVSQPQSYNYIMSEDTITNMRNTFEYLISNGYRSHETETCGLHFHVTRPDEATIDRILFLLETYKEEFIKFSRRKAYEISRWCCFTSDNKNEDTQKNMIKSLYYIKENKIKSSRYTVLNLTNSNTIEFRLFKGTLNLDTFLASVELVNNIVSLCSNKKININNITWTRLTSTPYAKKYCEEHNIITDRRPQNDNTLERRLKNTQKEITRRIKTLIKELKQDYNKFTPQRITEKTYFYYGIMNDSVATLNTIVNEINLLANLLTNNAKLIKIKRELVEFITYYNKAYRKNELQEIINMIGEEI